MPFIQQQLSADGVAEEGRVVANKAILEIITNDHVLSLDAVDTAGSGYAVGDTFRLDAGTPVQVSGDDFHATGRVTAISGSTVTAIEIISSGAYTALPGTTAIATITLTGAGDDNLAVDLSTQVAYWTEDDSDFTDLLTLFDWLATSTKSSNAPVIGGFSQLATADDGIRFTVGSSYSAILPWDAQPGSPPINTFYMSVPNQDPLLYLSTTERRVNVLITDGTNRQYAGMGLFIPFTDVDSNYPFPSVIHTQSITTRANSESWDSIDNAGVVNPINFSALGCYQYRNNLSNEWFGISADNNQGAQDCRAQMWPDQGDDLQWSFNHAPIPTGSGVTSVSLNPFTASGQKSGPFDEDQWFQVDASSEGAQGPAPLGIGSQLHFTVQAHIISNQPNDVQMIGFIDGFEAVHGRGLNNFDEIQNQDGRRYIVFDDTLSGDNWKWVAMEMN